MESPASPESDINLTVVNGAARIRVARALREESPSVEALRRSIGHGRQASNVQTSWVPGSPLSLPSLHPMTLRSHTRSTQASTASPSSNSSMEHAQSLASTGSLGSASHALALPTTPESYRSISVSESGSPNTTAAQRLPVTLASTPSRGRFRAWDLKTPPRFAIWEDAPENQSQIFPSGHVYNDTRSDDKENVYATVSDYDSDHDQEPQRAHASEVQWQAGPVDVFGLPIDSFLGRNMAQFSLDSDISSAMSMQPSIVETDARPTMQPIFSDEEDTEIEWNEVLPSAEFGEMSRLNESVERGIIQRWNYDRHIPMRDTNVQGQRSNFLEARRITHFQRHQNRRRRFVERDL
ncbi:hypothetical protein PENSTE_c001G03445 [Penicillium steckii]|uniref:Uncharacterized protein n=1 Tax=Penicillium steckii TaxID=303698 RepID=A0A1V6TYU7_9EURO|nr:hypothetical protein PENSTE_c001G03445 [Penicillium steckii]